MATFKLCLICACLVWQHIQVNNAEVLTDVISTVNVDPYASYYEQYLPLKKDGQTAVLYEKQGFGNAVENILGNDAGLILGTIGAIAGTMALIGVALNNNNVDSLSKDQDSICTASKAVGDTSITALTDSEVDTMNKFAGMTVNNVSGTKVQEIITALNGYVTPSC